MNFSANESIKKMLKVVEIAIEIPYYYTNMI